MTLQGFYYLGKQFDFAMKGSGKYISEIDVEGVRYTGTNILPADAFRNIDNKRIRVSVQRTSQMQTSTFIKSGYGIELKNYSYQKGAIKATLGGLGTCNLKIHAENEPKVIIDGSKTEIKYYPDLKLAIVKIIFNTSGEKFLEILS
jgi:hypothetical protein